MQRLYIDKQGRVTIPNRIRRQLGIGEDTPLFIELGQGGLTLRPLAPRESTTRDAAEDGEVLVSGQTLGASDRRRILHRLAG